MIDPPDGVWKRRKKRENVEQGKIEQFKEAVAQCNSIVFFGGAGVSTESGIPDSEAQTVCITRSTNIHRRRLSVTALYAADGRIL